MLPKRIGNHELEDRDMGDANCLSVVVMLYCDVQKRVYCDVQKESSFLVFVDIP